MNKQEKVMHEIIATLKLYVKIQTLGDVSSYDEAVELFIQCAQKDGLIYQKIVLDSGLPMLIITVEGSDPSLKSLVLNHHMDVVPAQKEGWITAPFAGYVHRNKVYGRGTQDMKGVGVCHYYALKDIAHSGKKPKRTIHMVMVPDEEQGGFKGTGNFVKHPLFNALNIGYVVDEGEPSGIANTVIINTQERKPLQISITVEGRSGHGSRLLHYNAMHTLLAILQQFVVLHNASVRMFYDEKHKTGSGCLNSFHITSVHTYPLDASINTIPMSASATIDIRIAPESSIKTMLDKVDAIVSAHKHAQWHIIAVAEEYDDAQKENVLEHCFEHSIAKQQYVVIKQIFEGATDMRFYRALGIEAIGCTPFVDPSLLHAHNEYVSYDSLYSAYTIFLAFLEEFCYGEHL